MSWRSFVTWVIIHLVLFSSLGAYGAFYYLGRVHKDRDLLLKENTERLMGYIRREQRIEDMTDVLVRSYDLDSIRAYYYSFFFDEMSRKYGFDWEWYAALMRMESNFNPSAKSKSRPPAKGLMQIKEKTIKDMCDSLHISYRPDTTVWDDVASILCGAHYFSMHARKKGAEYGARVYVGGRDYLRTIKYSREDRQYVKEYKSSVVREFRRLSMAYDGVRASKNRPKIR